MNKTFLSIFIMATMFLYSCNKPQEAEAQQAQRGYSAQPAKPMEVTSSPQPKPSQSQKMTEIGVGSNCQTYVRLSGDQLYIIDTGETIPFSNLKGGWIPIVKLGGYIDTKLSTFEVYANAVKQKTDTGSKNWTESHANYLLKCLCDRNWDYQLSELIVDEFLKYTGSFSKEMLDKTESCFGNNNKKIKDFVQKLREKK